MANSTAIINITTAILSLMLLQLLNIPSFSSAVSNHHMGWFPMTEASSCKGNVGGYNCMLGDDDQVEELLDSENIYRRMLAIKSLRRYISYGALRRNIVPCSRRGASYYNCQKGAQKNPYTRGCNAITRCRR